MAFPLLGLFKGLTGIGKSLVESKDKKNQRVHDENMADGKRITSLDDNDAAYAIAKLKEQQSTYKDDLALLTLLFPAWLAFMKWDDFFGASFDGPSVVAAGFAALAKAPLWYQTMLASGISTALGMSEYAKHRKRSRLSIAKGKSEE